MQKAYDQLENISKLTAGWIDGQGTPPSDFTRIVAKQVLDCTKQYPLLPVPVVSPADGEVDITWVTDDVSTHLTVDEDGTMTVFCHNMQAMCNQKSPDKVVLVVSRLSQLSSFINDIYKLSDSSFQLTAALVLLLGKLCQMDDFELPWLIGLSDDGGVDVAWSENDHVVTIRRAGPFVLDPPYGCSFTVVAPHGGPTKTVASADLVIDLITQTL